jgi:4-amino-4-deoxy-L-arabinose transferase-like glycosyltransferase
MPFSGMLTVALVCAATVLGFVPSGGGIANGGDSASRAHAAPTTSSVEASAGRRNQNLWVWLLLLGFFMGLAVLAKGPAAIVLMGGAVFFWALFTKRWRDAVRLVHPIAIAAFCATALPWYVLCTRRNPEFFRIFIVEHNFKRYLTPEFQHIQPFWYYGVVLLVAFLPWSAIFVRAAVSGSIRLWRTQRTSEITSLLLCWSVFCVLFFSISKSKLPGYILPAIPALAVLLALVVFQRKATVMAQRIAQILTAILLFAVTLGLATLPSLSGAIVLGTTGLAIVAVNYSRLRSRVPIVCATGWALAFYLLLSGSGREALDEDLSTRRALEIAQANYPTYSTENASFYRLQRSAEFALNFYLHRQVSEWSPSVRTHGWVFTTRKETNELESLGLDCPKGYVSAAQSLVVCVDDLSVRGAADGGKVK